MGFNGISSPQSPPQKKARSRSLLSQISWLQPWRLSYDYKCNQRLRCDRRVLSETRMAAAAFILFFCRQDDGTNSQACWINQDGADPTCWHAMGVLTTGGIEQFAVKFQNSFIPYFETHYHYAYTLFTVFGFRTRCFWLPREAITISLVTGKGKADWCSAVFAHTLRSAALSSHTGPAFSLGRKRLKPALTDFGPCSHR